MMTILVTGSNGLLGQKIIYALRNRNDVRCISTALGENRMHATDGYIYEPLDISNKEEINRIFRKYSPHAVINTAAMTNVDACESRREEAWKLNVTAVENIADACKDIDAHLIHLSTDFIFNGSDGPYIESDHPEPQSYYSYTKLEGEKKVMRKDLRWTIIRTIIIYGVVDGNTRSNVVLWAINAMRNEKVITVINDQFRSPTLAEDLAKACISAAERKATGIYHVSGREVMNILDMVEIVADFFKLDKSYIKPVTSDELNQPAKRPPVTGFIISKAENDLDFHPCTFLEGLSQVKKQLELVVQSNSK